MDSNEADTQRQPVICLEWFNECIEAFNQFHYNSGGD